MKQSVQLILTGKSSDFLAGFVLVITLDSTRQVKPSLCSPNPKIRYKGRRKQSAKLHTMFTLLNLYLADKRPELGSLPELEFRILGPKESEGSRLDKYVG